MPVTIGRAMKPRMPVAQKKSESVDENDPTASAPMKKNAITAVAQTSHLSCSRSSPRERRKRTTSAANDSGRTNAPETLKTS